MDIAPLTKVISTVAPLLGAAIAGTSPVAAVLVALITNIFGAKHGDVQDLIAKIAADPLATTKLKQLEYEHYDSIYQAEVSDRENARAREETFISLGKRDWLMDGIALVVVLGYFIMCDLVVFNKINTDNQQVLYMMYGQLTGGFIMVLSYYFGSSKKQ